MTLSSAERLVSEAPFLLPLLAAFALRLQLGLHLRQARAQEGEGSRASGGRVPFQSRVDIGL